VIANPIRVFITKEYDGDGLSYGATMCNPKVYPAKIVAISIFMIIFKIEIETNTMYHCQTIEFQMYIVAVDIGLRFFTYMQGLDPSYKRGCKVDHSRFSCDSGMWVSFGTLFY
jgi:hypothetical protein